MANPKDLEKLCQGPKVWNAWREENRDRVPDLRNVSLTLAQRQLGPSTGGPVNLQDADLGGARLPHATLSGADLSNSSLIGADLVHARLDGADFSGADLTDAILDYADLTGAKLDGAILIGTSFVNARWLTEAQISSAYGNASTALPDYLQPPESWFPDLDDDIFYHDEMPDEPIHESNPYHVLGVDVSATPDEIRTAFRNLVKQVHPDLNPGDQDALETFKRVSIAYGILGNSTKRSRYDRGEIGGDGDVTPEFEAKQQFRRYAYRFYAAAAASLFVAIGVLAAVWHTVLTDDATQTNRVEITVTTPPKQMERLSSTPDRTMAQPLATDTAGSKATEQDIAENPLSPAEASDTAVPDTASSEAAARHASVPDAGLPEAATPDDGPAEARLRSDVPESGAENAVSEPSAGSGASEPRHETAQKVAEDTGDQKALDAAIEPPSDSRESEPKHETAQKVTQEDTGDRQALADERDDKDAEDPVAINAGTGEDEIASQRHDSAEGAADEKNQSAPPSVPTSSEIRLSDMPAAKPKSLDASSKDPGKEETTAKDTRSASLDIYEDQMGQPDPLVRQKSENDLQAKQNDLKAKNDRPADQPNAYSPHSDLLLRKTKARKIAPDKVSDILRRRAVKKMSPNGNAEATASFDALTEPNAAGEQEEVWDIYTHSLPDDQNRTEARPWPEMLAKKKKAPTNVSLSAPPRPVGAPDPRAAASSPDRAPRQPVPEVSLRQQAISEILAGGL